MGSIVVDVMLKPEILDPQGQAVAGALPRLGFTGFTDVRQGKRFVLSVDGDVTDDHLAAARAAASTLLSNPVIEDVVAVHAEDTDYREDAEQPDPAGPTRREATSRAGQPRREASSRAGQTRREAISRAGSQDTHP